MKTRLPFSTISFNTEAYLRLKLDELVKGRILSEWYFIAHKGEDDEAGKRDHFHVYMLPAKQVQTDDIRTELVEYDPENPDKPRKCLAISSSRFAPWYLYAIHDKAYLASKGQARKYHYAYENVVSFDEDVLFQHYREIDLTTELGAFKAVSEAVEQGLSFVEFFKKGKIPIPQIRAFEEVWYLLTGEDRTERAGRPGHPTQTETGDIIDPATGELIIEQLRLPDVAFDPNTGSPFDDGEVVTRY